MGVTVRREYSFFIVPADLIDDERLGLKGLLVYTALARRADQEGESFPSVASIAKTARLGVTATKEGIAELESLGYLTRTFRARDDGAQTSSLYTLVAKRRGGVATDGGAPSPGDGEGGRQATTKKTQNEEDSDEEEILHTPPANENEPNSDSAPSPVPIPPNGTPGSEYPRLLLEAWAKLGDKALQPPNEISFLTTAYPRARHCFASIHSREVLQAIDNFGEILSAPPGRYFWNARITFEGFMERHLERFLPANFKPDDFLPRETRGPRRDDPVRPALISTYEPIPEENKRPTTEADQAEVDRLMREAAGKSPAAALLARDLGLSATE